MNATDKVNIESCWAEVVAQWLECRPTNLVVVGSNPTRYRTFFLLFPFLLSVMSLIMSLVDVHLNIKKMVLQEVK